MRPWQHQEQQGQQGVRIVSPLPNNGMNELWGDDDDTQPSMTQSNSITKPQNQETKVFPPYVYTPYVKETSNKLFVYGSAMRGFSLNLALCRETYIGTAKTPASYKMINIDDAYPVIVSRGNTAVVGELYEVAPRTLEYLDSVQDCPVTNHRDIVDIVSIDHNGVESTIRAHVYIMNLWKTPMREEYIPSGSWIEWKKNERTRNKEKKEKFKQLMAKGKADAEARRQSLNESLNGSHYNGTFVSTTGRTWDPIKARWIYPTLDEKRGVLPNAKKISGEMVHISEVPIMDLRIKLKDDGETNVDIMSDRTTRVMAMARYGLWYEVETSS